jgi:hypothetical protein
MAKGFWKPSGLVSQGQLNPQDPVALLGLAPRRLYVQGKFQAAFKRPIVDFHRENFPRPQLIPTRLRQPAFSPNADAPGLD